MGTEGRLLRSICLPSDAFPIPLLTNQTDGLPSAFSLPLVVPVYRGKKSNFPTPNTVTTSKKFQEFRKSICSKELGEGQRSIPRTLCDILVVFCLAGLNSRNRAYFCCLYAFHASLLFLDKYVVFYYGSNF
jgi:hypothetical protein